MNLLFLDHRLPYLHSDADEFSMLTLPAGSRSLLDECLHQFSAGNGRTMNVSVVPNFSAGPAYARAILDATDRPVRIVSADEAGATVSDNVAWDDIMVVDPRYLPTDGYASLPAMGGGHYRGATHVVAMGADPAGTHESVECDTRGCVQRVQRLYLHMNWPAVAKRTICCSRVPAQAIAGGHFRSLPELRSKLSDAGMLSRDLPLMSAVFDLGTEAGLLALCESLLRSAPHAPPSAGYEQRGAQVWLAPGSRVHPSARLVGPLVLHERVTVAEAATIVGPSVLGAGCRIGRGAIVAHSVLARNTVVAPGSAIRERFLAGRVPREHAGSPATTGTCQPDLTLTVASSRRGRRSFVSSDMSAASRGIYQFAKRAVDIGLAVVGLLLLLPLLVVVAILIKLDARGPVLFAHGRERRGGKEFPCWKFRTMVADAHARQRELYRQNEVDGPQFKLRQDPRVTRVGRYLRMTNIDELPQLFNVLLGHMSIVGPRPSPFRENQICVPWRRARLSVRPGITGLWQICRDDRGGGDFHQWIYYDLMYVRHCSVRLDIKILGATLLTLGGRWRVPLSWLIPSEGSVRPLASPTAVEPALIS